MRRYVVIKEMEVKGYSVVGLRSDLSAGSVSLCGISEALF